MFVVCDIPLFLVNVLLWQDVFATPRKILARKLPELDVSLTRTISGAHLVLNGSALKTYLLSLYNELSEMLLFHLKSFEVQLKAFDIWTFFVIKMTRKFSGAIVLSTTEPLSCWYTCKKPLVNGSSM